MNANRNKVESLLAAQRLLEYRTLRCCIALAAMIDCHRDEDGLVIQNHGNGPALMGRWEAALKEGRAALGARHEAVQALAEACKGIGAEPLEDPQRG